jgi:hypothetical protein
MKIFGKDFFAYIKFQKIILLLILIVGFLRLGLSLGGLPVSVVKWFSITWVMFLGLIYYSIRVHTSGFGSYRHLLPLLLIQGLLGQMITVVGIAIAIYTNKDNIFSLPEYSQTFGGRTWMHAGGHIILGGFILSLMWWPIAALIMFVTKKIASQPGQKQERPSRDR